MRHVTQKRMAAVFFATLAFTAMALLLGQALGWRLSLVLLGAPLLGFMIACFEVFYFQGDRGRWLREMHPIKANAIYVLVLAVMFVLVQHAIVIADGRWAALPGLYERYPITLPAILSVSFVAVLLLRIVSFIGGRNVIYLLLGKYRRPVWEQKIFMFLDITGSSKLVDKLGPEKSNLLFGKFMFDASGPIVESGGEIYRYQGDGFVAIWDCNTGATGDNVVNAVDALYAMVERERPAYEADFGVCPDFRAGAHAGEIITCEEGDIRRNIAFYGDTINIAART